MFYRSRALVCAILPFVVLACGGFFQSGRAQTSAGGQSVSIAADAAGHCPVALPSPPKEIDSMRDLAALIFQRYGKGKAIGVAPVNVVYSGGIQKRMCLAWMSGLELSPQSTFLLSAMTAAMHQRDSFSRSIEQAIESNQKCAGLPIILAGHSLGGMEAQNVASFGELTDRIQDVFTFGAPQTADQIGGVHYHRFMATRDPIPYSTLATSTYRGVSNQICATDTTIGLCVNSYDSQGFTFATMAKMKVIRMGINAINGAGRDDADHGGFPFALPIIRGVGGIAKVGWLAYGFARMMGPYIPYHVNYPSLCSLTRADAMGAPTGGNAGNGRPQARIVFTAEPTYYAARLGR
jgi:hypothetical protein